MQFEKEAKLEFRVAERLAPDVETTREVHKERVRLGLIKIVSVSHIDNGKITSYIKELPDKD